MQRILSLLLLINVTTTIYLLLTLRNIHQDVSALKETATNIKSVVQDTWGLAAGGVMEKTRVISKHLGSLKGTLQSAVGYEYGSHANK